MVSKKDSARVHQGVKYSHVRNDRFLYRKQPLIDDDLARFLTPEQRIKIKELHKQLVKKSGRADPFVQLKKSGS